MHRQSLVSRLGIAAIAILLAGSISIVSAQSTPESAEPDPEPTGVFLNEEEIAAFLDVFSDNPLTGGQVAPRFSKFVNEDVFLFVQFDNPSEPTELQYVGIGVKSVFCAETQPDPSFTHFHNYDAPEYAEGHGTNPGDQGYWMTWAAVGTFESFDGRAIEPGIDYEFALMEAPECGADIPEPDFTPEDAQVLSADEVAEVAALFDDPSLIGGQNPPRIAKWVNDQNMIFLQFDSLSEPTAIRYIGVGTVGVFCSESRQSPDFTHYHRFLAAEYPEGHGGEPGEEAGFWLLWIAAESFEARDGRQIVPGVDRQFALMEAPECGEMVTEEGAHAPSDSAASVAVSMIEWEFLPSTLTIDASQPTTFDVANTGTVVHTFTIPQLDVDSGALQPGVGATLQLPASMPPGRYEFLCTMPGHVEAGMVGEIVLQ